MKSKTKAFGTGKNRVRVAPFIDFCKSLVTVSEQKNAWVAETKPFKTNRRVQINMVLPELRPNHVWIVAMLDD